MINNSAVGDDWEDVRKELFTPEEIAESDLRVAVISALVSAREEQGISHEHAVLEAFKEIAG